MPTGCANDSGRDRAGEMEEEELCARSFMMGTKKTLVEKRCGAWHMAAGTLPVESEEIDASRSGGGVTPEHGVMYMSGSGPSARKEADAIPPCREGWTDIDELLMIWRLR